jgi:hypothetical protein
MGTILHATTLSLSLGLTPSLRVRIAQAGFTGADPTVGYVTAENGGRRRHLHLPLVLDR